MIFNPSKPVQTRDGRKARIICSNRKGTLPIVALIEVDGLESARFFYATGQSMQTSKLDEDLVNIPEEIEMHRWFNIYGGGENEFVLSMPFTTREGAVKHRGDKQWVAATVEVAIKCRRGDGL